VRKAEKAKMELLKKATQDKVTSLLYGTPEALAAFKKKTGTDFSPALCLAQLAFKDKWLSFQKSLSPNDRTLLRALAVEIHHRQAKRDAGRPTSSSSLDSSASRSSAPSKRHHSPSSSEASSRGIPAPKNRLFKIPKPPKGARGPPAPHPPPATSSEDDLAAEMEGSHIADDEVPGGDDIELMEDEDATYADQAKKGTRRPKDRKDEPFLLKVHLGKDDKRVMTRETWRLLRNKFAKACLDKELADEPTPTVSWTGFARGTGFIAPVDQDSQVLAIQLIGSLSVADHVFRAWKEGERSPYEPLTFLIPAAFSDTKDFPAAKFLDAGIKRNALPGCYVLYSALRQAGNKQRLVRFGADPALFEVLAERKGLLPVAGMTLEIHSKGVKLGTASAATTE